MSNQKKEDDLDEGQADESREAENSSTDDQTDDDENKRGEGHGNLKRRSDWFQKRHGGG
jgi:hypothetical protein